MFVFCILDNGSATDDNEGGNVACNKFLFANINRKM